MTSFERGVVGLADDVNKAMETTMFQLRYVGEWHSHPRRSSSMPSSTDIIQLFWLENKLRHGDQPGLMLIAADHGAFSLVIKPNELREPEEAKKRNGTG
jgi:Prokaryotic homologs of the JAB domain